MEIRKINEQDMSRKNTSQSNINKPKKNEPYLVENKERGTTPLGGKESCANCIHRMGHAICLNDNDYLDGWCPLYEYHGGPRFCKDCELMDECEGTTQEGKCQKFKERVQREHRLEELAEEGTLKIKRG